MKRFLMGTALLCCSAIAANAATVGESPLAGGGSVDGWSGVSILDGYGGIPAGESVSAFNYYADEGRADGTRSVQPIIAQESGGSWSIWAVGPVDTPAAGGEYSIPWSTAAIPDDGNSYHPAFWQWADGVDDTNGGVVPFNGGGGSGMFQFNADGTSYVPAVGDELTSGHASGVDGRAYQINVETVPEPATGVLAALALGTLALFRRRK